MPTVIDRTEVGRLLPTMRRSLSRCSRRRSSPRTIGPMPSTFRSNSSTPGRSRPWIGDGRSSCIAGMMLTRAVETIDDYDFHPPNDLRRFRVPIVGVRHLDDTAFVADVRYGDVVLRHYAFADRWYKINITTDLDGELIETAGSGDVPAFAFNCDIATPMVRDARSVLAVDLWLDVLVGADGVSCDVRDEDDFAAAIEHGWLSEREAAGALAGLRELLELTERNQLVSMLTAVCPFGVGRVPAALPADTVPTSTVPQLHPFVRMSW
jgi:hypothetical protein